MIKLFKRHKLKEEKIANVFVDHFLTTVDNGFPELAALINESPEFVECPNVGQNDSDKFLLIALAANLMLVERVFPPHKDQLLARKIVVDEELRTLDAWLHEVG